MAKSRAAASEARHIDEAEAPASAPRPALLDDVHDAQDAPVIRLPDGATASRRGDALELRDGEGRLLVRYAHGSAEIHAATGDLTLAAPQGQVVIRSGADVTIEAARDITHRAARRVALTAGPEGAAPQIAVEPGTTSVKARTLEVEAGASSVVAGRVAIVAAEIATTATRVSQRVERWELTATRIVEQSRDAFRDVADLAQTRIGRARTMVKGIFALTSRRTVMTSKDETKVDGKKVLLG